VKAPRLRPTSRSESDDSLPPLVGTFLRGLSVGALVGAAIAGSVLLRRIRHDEGDRPPRR
jgi:hypothetical protein